MVPDNAAARVELSGAKEYIPHSSFQISINAAKEMQK